jgi:Secretion system C-terminal sorting domain
MKLTLCSTIICLLLFFENAKSQVFSAKQNVSMTPGTNGFYEYLPQGYDPQSYERYPLLIFVHGLSELGNGNTELVRVLNNGTPLQISQGIFPVSFSVGNQSFKFIVLAPQFTQWPNSVQMDNVINYAISNYKVNLNKVYLTGISMGGGVIWEYCGNNLNYANRITAIVPICGASYPDYWRGRTIAAGNIAVWATHNDGDGTSPVSYTNGYVTNINASPLPTAPQSNPLAIKTIFNSNSHDAWTATYDLNFKENGKNVYEWMLSFQKNVSVVPVTGLSSFNVVKQNGQTLLQWKTLTEINNTGFQIQRSADGVHYDSVGFVAGRGVNGNGALYTFYDQNALNGINYYRLKQINIDGSPSYSMVRSVEWDGTTSFSIYPNPVQNILYIKSSVLLMGARLQIYDAGGRVIKSIPLTTGSIVQVPLHNLTKGIYTAEITGNSFKKQVRFVKQ